MPVVGRLSINVLTFTTVIAIIIAITVLHFLPVDAFDHLRVELCLFKRFFHRPCLGCGTMHALSFMAHGRWQDAWHANPLSYLTIPGSITWIFYLLHQAKNNYAI